MLPGGATYSSLIAVTSPEPSVILIAGYLYNRSPRRLEDAAA